ncbi:MAG: hypothetical protein JWQ09_4187 [Segetibacter sp.]|nr:hypothetical protein [Segetibacter sp.]
MNGVPARVWEGENESGNKIHVFITRIAVDKANDVDQFEKGFIDLSRAFFRYSFFSFINNNIKTMSRLLTALPKTPLEKREQETIELIIALKEKGFTEGAYVKPDRVFTKGEHIVKINIREGVVSHSGQVFRGNRYRESIGHIQSLNVY